jgi:2'-5' RNA ligase
MAIERFSFYLIPTDKAAAAYFARAAQALLGRHHDGYILNPNGDREKSGRAHITVCLFEAEEATANAIFARIPQRDHPVSMSLNPLQMHAGSGLYAGRFWYQHRVALPNSDLTDLHETVIGLVDERKLHRDEAGNPFTPHLSLGRATQALTLPEPSEEFERHRAFATQLVLWRTKPIGAPTPT